MTGRRATAIVGGGAMAGARTRAIAIAIALATGTAIATATALTAGGLSGCAPERGAAYERSFAEAERAESAGRYAEAEQRYDAARATALLARDRDHAAFLAASMHARTGDLRGAVARYDAIADAFARAHPDGRAAGVADAYARTEAASSAYQAALLVGRLDGDAARAARLEQLLRRFPDEGAARPALAHLVRDRERREGAGDASSASAGHETATATATATTATATATATTATTATDRAADAGPRATLAWLDGLAARLGATELGEAIAYERAAAIARTGDAAAARDAYVAIADRWPYPRGSLFDDALYHASELDEALGHPERAIADLDRLLAERETSHFIGSYERPRYDDALFRVGVLARDRLHDPARARAAFHRLAADFPTSTLRDDAFWAEAALLRAAGDARAACDRLADLARDVPGSRYVPCAVALCPDLAPPPRAGRETDGTSKKTPERAPATCRAYLTRAADPRAPAGGAGATGTAGRDGADD